MAGKTKPHKQLQAISNNVIVFKFGSRITVVHVTVFYNVENAEIKETATW